MSGKYKTALDAFQHSHAAQIWFTQMGPCHFADILASGKTDYHCNQVKETLFIQELQLSLDVNITRREKILPYRESSSIVSLYRLKCLKFLLQMFVVQVPEPPDIVYILAFCVISLIKLRWPITKGLFGKRNPLNFTLTLPFTAEFRQRQAVHHTNS